MILSELVIVVNALSTSHHTKYDCKQVSIVKMYTDFVERYILYAATFTPPPVCIFRYSLAAFTRPKNTGDGL